METAETEEEQFQEIVKKVKAENPGTEIWLGGHPRTGDRWIYRPATPAEVKTYRDLQSKAKERGEDFEASFQMLVLGGFNDDSPPGCVLWPPKPELKKLILKRPFLPSTMAAEICDVTGLIQDVTQKKL